MKKIAYDVPRITQGISECLQASVTQLLHFHNSNKSIDQVKKEVPVYVSSEGKPVGTSLGHMGSYLLQQGFKTTFHIVDVEIFDRSWETLTTDQIIEKLAERENYIKHSRYDKQAMHVIFDGYRAFLKMGGEVVLPLIDEDYLVKQLEKGPFLAIVSYNLLHNDSKYRYDAKVEKYIRDDTKGNPTTHTIVISGYENHQFTIVDPDIENGGIKTISAGKLIGSIYLAETDFDSIIVTITQK